MDSPINRKIWYIWSKHNDSYVIACSDTVIQWGMSAEQALLMTGPEALELAHQIKNRPSNHVGGEDVFVGTHDEDHLASLQPPIS